MTGRWKTAVARKLEALEDCEARLVKISINADELVARLTDVKRRYPGSSSVVDPALDRIDEIKRMSRDNQIFIGEVWKETRNE